MVRLTPRELAALGRGDKEDDDDVLTTIDRTLIGSRYVQLHVPLDDPVKTRDYLDMMEGLAGRCREAMLRYGHDPRALFITIKAEFSATQRQMKDLERGAYRLRAVEKLE